MPASDTLDEIIRRVSGLSPEKQKEIEAAVADKLAQPWLPSPGPQTDAYLSKADVLLYGGQGGGGKALALDTPIPTPGGWSSMAALQVGDEVFDEGGKICRVVDATPVMIGRRCYRVRFSDGAEVIADADHQWVTLTAKDRDRILRCSDEWRAKRKSSRPGRAKVVSQKPWVSKSLSRRNRERTYSIPAVIATVKTTDQIAATLVHKRALNHSIDVAGALELHDADLPIDPYLFGAWLGDGSSYGARLTIAEAEMAEICAVSATAHGWHISKGATRYDYGVAGGLKVALREAGVLQAKHIPAVYLRASREQRIALLQGLLDTDGHCTERGAIELSLCNFRLVSDALELVRSLGCKANVTVGVASFNGGSIGPKYRIKFMASFDAFRLKRKLDRQKIAGHRETVKRRYIESVEAVESVPVRCIQVDSPSRQYLCGRELIPTHNSDLGLGLAFTKHRRALVLRRKYTNLGALTERALEINGSRNGFNGSPPPLLRTADGRYIQFAGNQHPGDEQDWQGQPFDLKVFDEATQFLEAQVRFHLGWLRSTTVGQRVRAVLPTNPPIDANGDWIVGMFRPWLDVTHPNPAKHGELRWYLTDPSGKDVEVPDATPVVFPGKTEPSLPMSRTFIPAKLSDNPYLINTGYQAKLDGLPEPLRSAVRDGNFMAVRADAEFQVIPTEWIVAAQGRWAEDGGRETAMSALGVDVSYGGDSTQIATRFNGWFAPLDSIIGGDTKNGNTVASRIVQVRRDRCPIVVDMGGGYGGAVSLRLADNDIEVIAYNGANASNERTEDGASLTFYNKRAESWWRLREALDPNRQGGSIIALPDDPELRADLAAPTWKLTPRGIQIESKDDIRARIGRSPDKGDAVVMCWSEGQAAITSGLMSMPISANRGHSTFKTGHMGAGMQTQANRGRRR